LLAFWGHFYSLFLAPAWLILFTRIDMIPGKIGVISVMIDESCAMIGTTFGKTDGKSVTIDAITNGASSRKINGTYVTIGLTSDETSKTCAETDGTSGMILVGELSKRGEILWKITNEATENLIILSEAKNLAV